MVNINKRCDRCYHLKNISQYRDMNAINCAPCEDAIAIAKDEYRIEGVETKIRKCLKCDREFKSTANRICEGCSSSNQQYDGVEIYGIN